MPLTYLAIAREVEEQPKHTQFELIHVACMHTTVFKLLKEDSFYNKVYNNSCIKIPFVKESKVLKTGLGFLYST